MHATGKSIVIPVDIPWGKIIAAVLGLITVAITTLGIVWGAATMSAGKADKTEVQAIKERMYSIEKDVAVIREVVERAHGPK